MYIKNEYTSDQIGKIYTIEYCFFVGIINWFKNTIK